MNFIQILKRLEAYSISLPYVNSTNLGDIYEYLNGKPNVKYAAVNIDITQSTRNDNLTSYNVYLYYIDRLKEDKSNWKEIKTVGELVLSSIINYAARDLGDIDDGWTITFFEQQFSDFCAGAYVNFNLEVPNVLGDCLIDEYQDDLQPLIDQLMEIIKKLQEENAELALQLKEILYRLWGTELE